MVFVFILGEMRKHFWSDSVSRLVWFSNRRIFWEERNDRNISFTNETTNSWGETVLWPNGKMNVTASLMMTLGQQSESLGGFLVTLKWLLERLYVLLYEICKTDVLWPGTLDKNLFVHWTVTALQTLSWTLKSDISFSQKNCLKGRIARPQNQFLWLSPQRLSHGLMLLLFLLLISNPFFCLILPVSSTCSFQLLTEFLLHIHPFMSPSLQEIPHVVFQILGLDFVVNVPHVPPSTKSIWQTFGF